MNCGYSMFLTINYRILFLTRTVKILPISTCNEFSNRRREWSSRLIGPETRMRGRRSASAVEVQGDCQHHAGVLIDFVLATGGEKRVSLVEGRGMDQGNGVKNGRSTGTKQVSRVRPITSHSPDFLASRSSLPELAEVWFAPALAPHAPPPALAAFPRFRGRFPHSRWWGTEPRDEGPRGFGRQCCLDRAGWIYFDRFRRLNVDPDCAFRWNFYDFVLFLRCLGIRR